MRAGLAVLIVVVMSRPELARSQSDLEEARPIPIHPGVTTMLQLPDEIVHTWIVHQGEIRVARRGNEVAIRPHAGTRAGVEASLKVETGTIHRTFRLRVVASAKDASRNVLVLAANAERDMEEPAPPTPPVKPAKPAAPKVRAKPAAPVGPAVGAKPAEPATPAVGAEPAEPATPVGEALAASAPPPAPPPAESATELARAATEPTDRRLAMADTERAATPTSSPPFDLSVHVIGALGTTELIFAGYTSTSARQPHRVIGARVAVHPHDKHQRGVARWGVEASISGELPVAPTIHTRRDGPGEQWRVVTGPRLRADLSLRAKLGTRLTPTASAGIGLQVHYRDMRTFGNTGEERIGDMPFEGVLALGTGLEYRTGDLFLGIDLHVRQGVLAGYRSVDALMSVGSYLDQGE